MLHGLLYICHRSSCVIMNSLDCSKQLNVWAINITGEYNCDLEGFENWLHIHWQTTKTVSSYCKFLRSFGRIDELPL